MTSLALSILLSAGRRRGTSNPPPHLITFSLAFRLVKTAPSVPPLFFHALLWCALCDTMTFERGRESGRSIEGEGVRECRHRDVVDACRCACLSCLDPSQPAENTQCCSPPVITGTLLQISWSRDPTLNSLDCCSSLFTDACMATYHIPPSFCRKFGENHYGDAVRYYTRALQHEPVRFDQGIGCRV